MILKWKRLLMLMGLCLFLNTCEKETNSSTLGWTEAEVLYYGVHGYRCYCCGGGILEIEGQRYLFKQFPEGAPEALQILETDLLEPIEVQISYRVVDPCDYFEIVEVQNIQLN